MSATCLATLVGDEVGCDDGCEVGFVGDDVGCEVGFVGFDDGCDDGLDKG